MRFSFFFLYLFTASKKPGFIIQKKGQEIIYTNPEAQKRKKTEGQQII
jgi:hypothetical protein